MYLLIMDRNLINSIKVTPKTNSIRNLTRLRIKIIPITNIIIRILISKIILRSHQTGKVMKNIFHSNLWKLMRKEERKIKISSMHIILILI